MMTGTTTKDESGKAFEREVADAYRALGYAVTENSRVAGKQTDLIARREVEGAPGIKLVVECKDLASAVGNGEVEAFVARIIGQCQANLASGGAMVSRNGFTPSAWEVAEPHSNVSLLSWNDLTSAILDVRGQLRDAIEHYESSEIFGYYLPLTLEKLSWDTLAPVGKTPTSTEDAVAKWLQTAATEGATPQPNVLVVLADFGAGKSTLLHRVHYERAKGHLAGQETRVPLFVPLRDFRHTRDVTALIRMAFREAYFRDLPSELLWQRLDAGRFHLLLDGFDEMDERTDAARRLELFGMLAPLLTSPCPAILTSRPSHFVERGELNNLLNTLLDADARIGRRQRGPRPAIVGDLRAELVNRFRETRPGRPPAARLAAKSTAVYRLRPLTKAQIKAFVAARKEGLRKAGSSPTAVVNFIERTYDLTDLATRPMLLAFIVESVIIGALDPSRSEELGASGLYDNYIQTKLELDVAKSPTRNRGLSVTMRREMAEALAVILYSEGILETNYQDALSSLIKGSNDLRQERRRQGLSVEQIAADFATSSFISLTDDGECRFIHKSFRGFFVACVIKNAFPDVHPLLDTQLEQEVLYFLGGFGPTESSLKDRLWTAVRYGKSLQRRNAFVAFLYTRPHHEHIAASSTEISEARFGRLEFADTRFTDLVWRDASVQDLAVKNSKWTRVVFEGSHIATGSFMASGLDVQFVKTTVETLELKRVWNSTLALDDAGVDSLSIDSGSMTINAADTTVGEIVLCDSRAPLFADDAVVERARVADSGLKLVEGRVEALIAERAVIELVHSDVRGGNLVDSLVVVGEKRRSKSKERDRVASFAFAISPASVVVCRPGTRLESPEGLKGGIFGEIENLRGVTDYSSKPWGIIHADYLLRRFDSERKTYFYLKGLRIGELVVTSTDRYERALKPGGLLRPVFELNKLVERKGTFTERDRADLADALIALRDAWRNAVDAGWGQDE